MASEEETLYCLCRQPYDELSFMIECDVCKDWFHGNCVGVQEHQASDIEIYHCPNCQLTHGPLVRVDHFDNDPNLDPNDPLAVKKRRNFHRHDYSESDEVTSKAVQTGTAIFIQELKNRIFPDGEEVILRLRGCEVTKEFLLENGFVVPIMVDCKDGLDLKVPPSSFTIQDVENHVGSMREIDVIDVSRQEDYKMLMREWTDYYNSPNRSKIFNVISLEFSNTKLANLVDPPRIVKELSWINQYWPSEVPEDVQYIRPEVQRYCLMGVKDSFTDFHIDFGGTSVWYHVLKGEKVFYLIRPTLANLTLYERWISSSNQSEMFFGDQVDVCYRCVVKMGQTIFIPTGWIHAVLTPIDSLVFGGNFLHNLNIELQIQVYEIEKRVKTPEKYMFPNFETLHWYAAKNLLDVIQEHNEETRQPPEYIVSGAKCLAMSLKNWTQKKDYIRRDNIPDSIQYGKLLKDFNKELKRLASQKPVKVKKEKKKKKKPTPKEQHSLDLLHSVTQIKLDKMVEENSSKLAAEGQTDWQHAKAGLHLDPIPAPKPATGTRLTMTLTRVQGTPAWTEQCVLSPGTSTTWAGQSTASPGAGVQGWETEPSKAPEVGLGWPAQSAGLSPQCGTRLKEQSIVSPRAGWSGLVEQALGSPGGGAFKKEQATVSATTGADWGCQSPPSVSAGQAWMQSFTPSAGGGAKLHNGEVPHVHLSQTAQVQEILRQSQQEDVKPEMPLAMSPDLEDLRVRIPKAGAYLPPDISVYDFDDEEDTKNLPPLSMSPKGKLSMSPKVSYPTSPKGFPTSPKGFPSSPKGLSSFSTSPKVKPGSPRALTSPKAAAPLSPKFPVTSPKGLKLRVSNGRVVSTSSAEGGSSQNVAEGKFQLLGDNAVVVTGTTTEDSERDSEEEDQLVVDETPQKSRQRMQALAIPSSSPPARSPLSPTAIKPGSLKLKLSFNRVKTESGQVSSQESTTQGSQSESDDPGAQLSPQDRFNMPTIRGGLNGSIADILEASGYGTETDFKIDDDIGRAASPTMRDAIQGMLSMSRMGGLGSTLSTTPNPDPFRPKPSMRMQREQREARRKVLTESETAEAMPTCFKDEEYVYPTLDLSDNEDEHVFKPRGRPKKDETWNPKAKMLPNMPKPERPQREGVRRESVESGLAAAAARLATQPPPKRQYIRRKPKTPKEEGLSQSHSLLDWSQPGTSGLSIDLSSSAPASVISGTKRPIPLSESQKAAAAAAAAKKPKKGAATAKQRLGKILKLNKLRH